MKKNILSIKALMILPLLSASALLSMHESQKDSDQSLIESVVVTPVPTERGFGFVRSTLDYIWNEEENLYNDLVTKNFNPKNSSYHRKLDTAIEIYVANNNSDRLTEIFNICRKDYRKSIKIGDMPTRMAHEFLVKEQKDKQLKLKSAIITEDQEFIKGENILLDRLQRSFTQSIKQITDLLNEHLKKRDSIVTKECDEIRKLKMGLVALHHLNKTFILPEDGYCSDTEKDENNVKNSYNDEYILNEKIYVANSMKATKDKITTLLEQLSGLNEILQNIKQLPL